MNPPIENRRSIRRFQPNCPVSREQLTELMKAALLAPSAYNNQPWELIAVTNRDLLTALSAALPNAGMCQTASAAIVLTALPKAGRLAGYFPQECGAATQNILLQATDRGLGSCWCGLWPREERMKILRTLLDIPEGKLPFSLIALGVAGEEPRARAEPNLAKLSFRE